MKAFAWAAAVLAALFASMTPAEAQGVPQVPQCQYSFGSNAYVPCTGVVSITPPATTIPLTGTASASGFAGPWYPQPGRTVWLTATGSWAGSEKITVTTDGICADGATLAAGPQYSGGVAGISGQNVTMPLGIETRANASWCINFTITSGSVAYRLAN